MRHLNHACHVARVLRAVKLSTGGTQLALRTAMKAGGAGVKKEKEIRVRR